MGSTNHPTNQLTSQPKMAQPSFKTLIVGDANVGKSALRAFLKRKPIGETYAQTMGVEVEPLAVKTTKGDIVFNLWDCAGDERFAGLGSGYFIGAQLCMVVFDVANYESFINVAKWIDEVKKVAPDAKFLVVANGIDKPSGQWRVRGSLVDSIYENTITVSTRYANTLPVLTRHLIELALGRGVREAY